MSLYGWFKKKGDNGFGHNSTAEEVTEGQDLAGKRILITGCNSGLGLETARVLGLRGATVLGTARTVEKARAALAGIEGAVPLECELSDPQSVQRCVEAVRQHGELDAIIANAGIMALPKPVRERGVELQLFTNHFGHFQLVTGLLDRLSETGRVVMVSSAAHQGAPKEGIRFDDLGYENGYSPWKAYGQSKLANILFARSLAKRFAGTRRVAVAIHPGVIATNLGRHMGAFVRVVFGALGPLFLKTVEQGAATQCYAAVHPAAAAHNGEYLADCNPAPSTPAAKDDALAERLWKVSEELLSEKRKAA
jgi:WW domain-containing oxidoreductase